MGLLTLTAALFSSCVGVNPEVLQTLLNQQAQNALTTTGGAAQSVGQTLQQSSGNILENLLSSFTSQVAMSEKELLGTWKYRGSDCVFESESLLTKAGGVAAAGVLEKKVDGYLSKVGVKSGVTQFVFKDDKTFTLSLGTRNVMGTYVYNPTNKSITLSIMGGLFSVSGQVARNTDGCSLLFEGDSILTILRMAGGLMGENSTLGAASSLLNSYKGLLIGFRLNK